MRDGILFEVTRDHLEEGLRGLPIGYCSTSFADPLKGCFYIGRPVAELAQMDPVEVIYLLYYGEAGSKEQIEIFQMQLNSRAILRQETLRQISMLPRTDQPLDMFAAALLVVGMCEGTGDYREDCLKAIASLPQIAAAVMHLHMDLDAVFLSEPERGYLENLIHMLQIDIPKGDELLHVIRLLSVFSFDSFGTSPCGFVGKVVASSRASLFNSLSAAMLSWSGSLSCRSSQDSLFFLQHSLEQLKEDDLDSVIQKMIRTKGSIPGFGHPLLRIEDPRAAVCYAYSEKHFSAHPLVNLALSLRGEGSRILKEHGRASCPTLDAIAGPMLFAAGFSYPEYFSILFGMSLCVGIAIQIVYERLEARNGDGIPIVQPLYLYRPRK